MELDTSPRGVVRQVNENLRYVVIDFASRQMPALDDRLGIFRKGRPVGEIRVTGPFKGSTVAADLLRGNAQPGDVVQPK